MAPEPEPRRRIHALWRRELIPDPRGGVGFSIVVCVILMHLAIAVDACRVGRGSYLFSAHPVIEAAAHIWLLGAPPLAAFLGLRHMIVCGDSPLPLLTVPLSIFLTVVTVVGVSASIL